MADRFLNPVNLPILEVVPATAGAGYVRIYGRGINAYALFPDGTEKLLSGDGGGVIVVGGGEVVREQLQYDNYEKNRKATDDVSAIASVKEIGKRAIESVTAAFAAEITETGRKAREAVTTQANIQEIAKRSIDTTSVIGQIQEFGKKAVDTIQAVIVPTTTEGRKAREDINNEVTAIVPEVGKRATDSVTTVAAIFEQAVKASESVSTDFEVSDIAKKAVEDISNTVTANPREIAKRAIESIQAAIVAQTELAKKALSSDEVIVNATAYLLSTVTSNGWTNPNNSLGNTTNTAATLTATSSGLLGTTNNTTNGTIVSRFRDINLGDLIINSVVLRVENQHANAGVPLVQPTCNISFEYSTNSGGTWTNFYTLTGQTGKGIRTVDLTAVIGQNRALLAGGVFRIRAIGSVTSGTGLGAASTASYFRCWLTINANRVY